MDRENFENYGGVTHVEYCFQVIIFYLYVFVCVGGHVHLYLYLLCLDNHGRNQMFPCWHAIQLNPSFFPFPVRFKFTPMLLLFYDVEAFALRLRP